MYLSPDENPPYRCPACASMKVRSVPQEVTAFELASGYVLQVDVDANGKTGLNADLAAKLIHDVEAGLMTEDQVFQQYGKTDRIPIRVAFMCSECQKGFTVGMYANYFYDFYSTFWDAFRAKLDHVLENLLGLGSRKAEEITRNYSAVSALVDRLFAADQSKYAKLKRLKDITVNLPAEKGGGFEQEIIPAILLAILSSATYDLAKAGGRYLLARLKGALSRRRIKTVVQSALQRRDLQEIVERLSIEDIKKLVGKPPRTDLTSKQKLELVDRAVRYHANSLRRELLNYIKTRKSGRT